VLRGKRFRSPVRLNRPGVVGPFRVLPDDMVASLLVARSRFGLNARGARPVRYSQHHPHPETRLTGCSSLGVRSPSRYLPKSPYATSRSHTTLMGFLPLQRIGLRESTATPVTRPGIRRFPPGVSSTVPSVDYGAALRFSQPLGDFFLSRPVHPFQVTGAPGVLPSRGSFLPRSSDSSSLPACLLDVSPEGCAAPVLGWERLQARGPVT